MILYLDTADKIAKIGVFSDGKLEITEFEAGRTLGQELLVHVNEALKKEGFCIKDLDGILVNSGPGSFTGLRIGLSAANAMAFSLNIPILSTKASEIAQIDLSKIEQEFNSKKNFNGPVVPEYGAKPNITKPKRGIQN